MPRPADPIAKPASAQMRSTFGFTTTNAAAMTAAMVAYAYDQIDQARAQLMGAD